jgi:hypothetical protein
MDDMNKQEACEWVHVHMIVDEMLPEDLVAAFTALVGHVPVSADRRHGLYRRCWEIVASRTGAFSRPRAATSARERKTCVK